jgi:aryl-alcohol dehydrogenase-like predicted oxidoreductase
MLTRRLGRTGHLSTIVIFGTYAVGQLAQEDADATMEIVLSYGVNHIDVAPTYHEAELRLGPWLEQHRHRFFVGCKTMARDRAGAREELHRSLERLRIDQFDLYQLHAVETMDQLDACTAPGGALEAILGARDEGLTRFVGITSHGLQAPAVEIAALERFDFDTVLFPLNIVLWADPGYRQQAQSLLALCADRDVGTMVIKALARGPWGQQAPRYHTWYEPFDEPLAMERALRFALSQPVTGVISAGEARLLPRTLEIAQRLKAMEPAEQEQYLATAGALESIFD